MTPETTGSISMERQPADEALGPTRGANGRSDEATSVSGPSEAPAPENSKTQRHDEIIVLTRWRRIGRRAARPHGALHRLKRAPGTQGGSRRLPGGGRGPRKPV